MPAAKTRPVTSYAVERFTLPNGLRVVLSPDSTSPVVGVAVYYDVGFRSEPEGRTGFAHLFEHLMFQGSANLAKMEHVRRVQGAGGTLNGSTHPDFTNYYQAVPSNALELMLFLEADRMRAPALTQASLDNQCAVVKEEINVNVNNQPYGGFPWISLPAVVFDTYPNAHNGYGSFVDLESATIDDAKDFFKRYYAPANAVLCVAGDLDVKQTTEWVMRYFGDLPTRRAPRLPSFAEPWLTRPRHEVHVDPLAPTPAVAIGYRVPDPIKALDDYVATVVLATLLTDGDASRLVRRLVLDGRLALAVQGYVGTFGDPWEMRDPALLTFEIHHPQETTVTALLEAFDDELDRLAAEGPSADELSRTQARMVAEALKHADQIIGRTLLLAQFEQQRGRAELVNELPALISGVTAEQVRAAAQRCRPETRAILEWQAGASA